jgi:UDP-glucose 4-epimerase
MTLLQGKRILITGGTGSLGKVLVRRILRGELGKPEQIIVFSRDEAKQYYMRLAFLQRAEATDELIYEDSARILTFRIGDVRDLHSITQALRAVDIVFNAAALKQVPACEYFPFEAVQTNIGGAENIVRAIRELRLPIETAVSISTDKACKPVNLMGMTKAIQERIFVQANLDCPDTRFLAVRYGNVLASRGSVIPLFLDQIRSGAAVTVTDPAMTRFLLSLNEAVDTIFAALRDGARGETFIPRVRSANILDLAHVLVGERANPVTITGIRPGEKLHEILIAEDEAYRTIERGDYYAIQPILPELQTADLSAPAVHGEFSSAHVVMTRDELHPFLAKHRLLPEMAAVGADEDELLR